MKAIKTMILCGSLILAGCTSSTKYGPCVGIGERQNPKFYYKLSGWNIAIGLIFIEVIVPPIIVATDETFCPVGLANESN